MNSAVFTFTILALKDDCLGGLVKLNLHRYGFESGTQGWTETTIQGSSSWGLQSTITGSGTQAWNIEDIDSTSDNVLISPVMSVPAVFSNIALSFWNQQTMESRTTGGCWDGGVLEVSQNGGPFNQVLTPIYTTIRTMAI